MLREVAEMDPRRRSKLKSEIAANTRNIRPEELERLLIAYGFEARRPRSGSSHTTYRYRGPAGVFRITVPRRQPFLLRYYVEEALVLVEKIELAELPHGLEPTDK